MSSPRSFFRTSLRLAWLAIAVVIITVAVLLASLRLALPLADRYHGEIAQLVGRILHHPVAITGLGASWHGFGPSIELQGVTIFDDTGRPLLRCAAARIDIGLLASLRHGQLELDQLTVRGAHVTVLRREDGGLALLGLNELDITPPNPAAAELFKQWIARQPRLAVEDSVLEWRDLAPDGRSFRFHGTRVEIRNRDGRHRIDADLVLPESLGRHLAITAEVSGDLFLPAEWSGNIYLRGEHIALGAFGTHAWSGIDLRDGWADVELWSDWRAGPQRIAGTVNASDVQFALQHTPAQTAASADSPPISATSETSPRANLQNPNTAGDKSPTATGPGDVSQGVHASTAAAIPPDARVPVAQHDEPVRDAHVPPADVVSSGAASQEGTPANTSLRARFQWQRTPEGWELNADRVGLRMSTDEASPAEWRIIYRTAVGGARDLEMGFSKARVEDAVAFVHAAQVLPETGDARLTALAPRGELRDGYVHYQWGGAAATTWLLRTDFQQLAWSTVEVVPGVTNVSGTLVSDREHGMVSIQAGASVVDAVRWFRAPLPLTSASGQFAWRRQGDSWQFGSDDIVVRNEDIHGRAAFRFVRLAGMEAPHLDFYADFDDGNGAHATRYLPVTLMHEKAVSWIDHAIVNGRITHGEARLQGWLNEFPFDHDDGAFEVNFHVADGVLDYAPGWPQFRDIATDVRFTGRSLEVRASTARTFDSNVTRAEVKVADLAGHPAVVTVNGTARGPTADVLRFVMQSPLHEKFGDYFANMEANGTSRLDLALGLPLADQPARVQGTLYFANSGLKLSDVDIDISAIEGRLNFYEGGVRGRNIRARLLDQPAVVKIRSEGEGAAHATLFEAEGMADAATIARRFLPPLAPRLEGSAPWHGTLKIASSRQGGTRLQINSPLTGVAVHLPEPLAKPADEQRLLTLDLPLPLKGTRATRVQYGDGFDVRLLLASANDAIKIRRGELHFGAGKAVLPDEDRLRVRGRIARLVVADWLALRGDGGSAARTGAVDTSTIDIALDTDDLLVLGQDFKDAILRVQRSPQMWQVDVEGATVAGYVQIPDDNNAQLTAEFTRLYLAAPGGGSATSGSQLDPHALPPLRIHVGDFHYGNLKLGDLTLLTARSARGMKVESLKAQSPLHALDLHGNWEADDGKQQSAFSLSFDSGDVGETLRSLGYADVVKDGKMHTDMNLTWPGSPADFALARAAGSVRFKIKDGRLLEVNPGAGRILGLLSLQALPRRLSLDFSDLFKKGLAFDQIQGDFAIENGVARTDNLTMDGPSARIIARGKVGLATEDYDQRIVVIPNVSAGLPLAGALAGGVAGGAAALLVERLLKQQINQIGRIEYQVTGPWSAPVVERVAGVGKETTENKGNTQ